MSSPLVMSSLEESRRLNTLLKAAGYQMMSSSSGGDYPPGGVVTFHPVGKPEQAVKSLPWSSLEAWLKEQGTYPSPVDIRCAKIEESMNAMRRRVDDLEDELAAQAHACAIALRKKLYLCYAETDGRDGRAFFTTLDPKDQTGDDWNDAPYEHNAGSPYDYHRGYGFTKNPDGTPAPGLKAQWPAQPFFLVRVGWKNLSAFAACEKGFHGSVDEINEGRLPWLYFYNDEESSPGAILPAGTTLQAFLRAVKASGGEVVWPQPREETR